MHHQALMIPGTRLLFPRLRLLCLALWLQACAAPQATTSAPKVNAAAPAPAPRQVVTPGLFLYEVRGPGGISHLLGTMHMGFGFEEVLTPDAKQRFQSAQRVMLEVDVSAANAANMMQRALLPESQSLRQLLGEPAWSALSARLGSQIPPPLMDRLKPWLPAVTLGLSDLENSLHEVKPNAPMHMMDVEVVNAAKAADKQLLFLESINEQLAMFDAIPLEEQLGELRRTLSDSSSQQGRDMLKAFASGDEANLTQSLFDPEQLKQAPGFYEVVLFQRNARWLPVLEPELAKGGVFVAVGAAHLLGERGLVAELRKRGYKVERVGN